MMSSVELELFLDTFSPLQYLCLCQPDRMTEGRDSNFFTFFRTTYLCKKDWYWTLKLVEVVLFHLSLLALILRCLQHWDTPPPSGIPWNCVTHKFIESAKNLVVEVDCRVFLCRHNTVVTFQAFHPSPISETKQSPIIPPSSYIWDITSVFNYWTPLEFVFAIP